MRVLVAVLLALAVSEPPSANPQSAIPNLQFMVHLDVSALDARGRIVADLTPSDFQVQEGGTLNGLESARLVRGEPRLVAVFLDEYHVAVESTAHVRDAMTRYVERDLDPNDLLVVMKPLDSLLSIRLTSNRDAALPAISAFERRKGALEQRSSYERNSIAGSPARIEAARTQVVLSALNALAIHLGSLGDFRKTLIVVAEDLPRLERRRGQESLPGLDTILRSANRSNVSVYPVDPTGARHELQAGQSPDGLRRLADETDGKTIAADAGLARTVAEASAYYLLTFRASAPDDGAFHALQVSVKRKGVYLQTRKGYWAP